MNHDEVDGIEQPSEEELAAQEKQDTAEQAIRDKIKMEIVVSISKVFNAEMDKQVVPHLDKLAYPDMVDIVVGVMQAHSVNMLDQLVQMGQRDAYEYVKLRWYHVGIEWLKSLWRQKWDAKIKADPELLKKIKAFEDSERQKNLAEGKACQTEGCPGVKETGQHLCITCIEKAIRPSGQ